KKDSSGKVIMSFNQPALSDEYSSAYSEALNGMIEKQMRSSAADIANFWYTAWVNGGKPDLIALDDPDLAHHSKKNYRKEKKAWKKGKILNLHYQQPVTSNQ